MTCTRCGKDIEGEPVLAKYADKGLQHKGKDLDTFSLHEECFAEAEFIEVWEWETNKDGEPELVSKGEQRRYRRVKS